MSIEKHRNSIEIRCPDASPWVVETVSGSNVFEIMRLCGVEPYPPLSTAKIELERLSKSFSLHGEQVETAGRLPITGGLRALAWAQHT